MKASMVAAGGLSGGLSSSIAGGKFIDGVKQGLITSGLNHLAHMVENLVDKSDLVKLLDSKEIDPDGKTDFDKASVNQFAKKVYPTEYSQAGNLDIETTNVTEIKGEKVYGFVHHEYDVSDKSNVKLASIKMYITKAAFITNLQLAETIGHEFQHYFDHYLGCYAGWANSRGGDLDYAHVRSEVNAWNWTHNWNRSNASFLGLAQYNRDLSKY